MKTLITGANGFVGSAVLRQLIGDGHEARAMVRVSSDRRNFSGLDVELVEGDLTDAVLLRTVVRGCENVFHVAADYRLWIPDPDTMYKVNVEGTRNLMYAAISAGVSKIIYTSSVAALGLTKDGTPADEDTPVSLSDKVGHYKRSKYLAEQEVLTLVAQEAYPIIIVNPSTPIGPRDIKPTPTGKIIVDTLNQKMPAYVDTGLNLAHVDDVARGHLLAFKHGAFGERYILGGEDMSLKAILETICNLADLTPPRIKLPHNAILPIAWLAELWARLTGNEPIATIDGVQMAKKKMFFSSEKAIAKLGYRARPACDGIADAITWFKENGYVGNTN